MAIWRVPTDVYDDAEIGDYKIISDEDREQLCPGTYETLGDLFDARTQHYYCILSQAVEQGLAGGISVRGVPEEDITVEMEDFKRIETDCTYLEDSDTEFILDYIVEVTVVYSYPDYKQAGMMARLGYYASEGYSPDEAFRRLCQENRFKKSKTVKFRIRSRENALNLCDDSTGYDACRLDEKVMPYNRADEIEGRKLSDCLVGVISLEDIELDTERRLTQHDMWQSIEEKGYVDIWEYAEKIGAVIRYAKLSLNGNIVSKLALPGKTVRVYEYYGQHSPYPCAINGQLTLPGIDAHRTENTEYYDCYTGLRYTKLNLKFNRPTILLDPYVCTTESKEREAISHECFHLEDHCRFYLLQNHQRTHIESFNMTEQEYDEYEADMEDYAERQLTELRSGDRSKWDEFEWVEWQANKGAVRKLMPRCLVRKRAAELYAKYRALYPFKSDVEITSYVVSELALDLHASKEMTKIRMTEVGYDIARGSSLFVGGRYVQPHRTSSGVISRNITYAISDMDAARLYVEDEKFRSTLLTGRFVFVDSFFCIDSPAYIIEKDGVKHLNEWALTHIDKCCLSFQVSRKHRVSFFDKVTLHSDRTNSDPIASAMAGIPLEALMESQQDIEKMCADLPATYGETLVYHRTRLGMSQEELAWRLGIKRTSLRDYEHNRMYEPSRIFFASVGIILKLPGYYTKDMMNKAHCSLEFTRDELKHLDFIVTFMYMRSFDDCQAVMKQFNLPPLLGRPEAEIEERLRLRKGKLAGKDARETKPQKAITKSKSAWT